jgi:hypothetical protein
MTRIGFVAYGAGVAGAALFAAPSAIDTISFHARPEVNSVQLWSLWLAATLAPLALSAIVWTTAGKFTPQWLPHLIFIPIAIVVYLQSMSLFLRVSGLIIHDGPAGEAFALGALYLLLALLVHLIAFAMAAVASVKGWSKGGFPPHS